VNKWDNIRVIIVYDSTRLLSVFKGVFIIEGATVDSRYYYTDGIRKMYQYNQTIDITSLNFYGLGMVGIQIWYRNESLLYV
jgi:hypothetical protein